MTRPTLAIFAALLFALAVAPAGASHTEITLRSTARIAHGAPLTLGDIAVIASPRAAELAAIVIHDPDAAADHARNHWLDINADDLARLVPVPKAQLLIRGSLCRVRIIEPAIAASSGSHNAPADEHLALGEAASIGPTLRSHIEARLAEHFGVSPDDLRLEFADRDSATLLTPTTGRIVEVIPMGTGSTMPIAITLYDRDRILHQASIRVGVEIRRTVAIATEPIARRTIIGPAQFTTEERFLPPSADPADPAAIVEHETRTNLRPGQPIDRRDVEPPIVVRIGDEVMVRCITGSIVVRQAARSLGTARDGERVLLRPISGGKTFYARMNGKGRAVLITGRTLHEHIDPVEDH
ncbi:MAG: flagellar basal body P-ring formation protein FlgA [Phycisphaeraceae bacterium]|nr:flagellar basal body P-ring formation protein FlgA [Phycisphaeraceae bacterium]MCW5762496.1 flagellar basal body P-ring formation protein FlgA [Phycisphaeraceae bacterium]